jgi:hypothetical protein
MDGQLSFATLDYCGQEEAHEAGLRSSNTSVPNSPMRKKTRDIGTYAALALTKSLQCVLIAHRPPMIFSYEAVCGVKVYGGHPLHGEAHQALRLLRPILRKPRNSLG